MKLKSPFLQRTAVLLTAATLFAGGSLVGHVVLSTEVARAESSPPVDSKLEQTISPSEQAISGRAEISAGHIDIGPRFPLGLAQNWKIQIHDSSGALPVWRNLEETVLRVSDQARQVIPDDPQYQFLGMPAGGEAYVIPQTQKPGVVWAGWNTQDPQVMDALKRQARFSLLAAQGPGSVMMYLQSGDLGKPQVLWDSRKNARQDIFMETNVHTHANWVFSKPGVYLLAVEFAADLKDGRTVSDQQLLRFAVGQESDAAPAFARQLSQVVPQQSAVGEGPAAGLGNLGGLENLGWLIGAGILAVVLVLILIAVLVRSVIKSRRARASVQAQSPAGRQDSPAQDSAGGGRA